MVNFVVFETTDSVIEVLWDIALAFFIVRLAFLYVVLTFVSSAKSCSRPSYCSRRPSGPTSSCRGTRCRGRRASGWRRARRRCCSCWGPTPWSAWAVGGRIRHVDGRESRVWLGGLLAAFALLLTALMILEPRPAGEEKMSHGHEESVSGGLVHP